jgi:hypothetical protein
VEVVIRVVYEPFGNRFTFDEMFLYDPLGSLGLDPLIGNARVAVNNIYKDVPRTEAPATNFLVMAGEIEIEIDAEVGYRLFEGLDDLLAARRKATCPDTDPDNYLFLVFFTLLQRIPLS